MGSWEMVRLGDVGYFQTGGTPTRSRPDYFEGVHPWITTPALGATYIDASNANAFLTEEAIDNSATKIIPTNSLMIGIRVGVGKASINAVSMCTNQDIVSISQVDISKISLEYLHKYIATQQRYLDSQKRGATIQGIKIELLKELLVPLPPLEIQQQIADVLDRASALIEKRKAQIDKLDLLVKSQFVEMFGNVLHNEKGWITKPIKDFATVRIGPFGSLLHAEDYIENGIPLVNPSHIVNAEIVPDPKLTLAHEKYEAMLTYALEEGDVVLGRRGEIGRCAVVGNGAYLCGTGSMFIRIECDYQPLMLQKILSSDAMRQVLEDKAVGVTMKNLNAGMIANLEVIVPPLDLQNRFASFVEAADKSKFEMRAELAKLEILYKSLMQKCFRPDDVPLWSF